MKREIIIAAIEGFEAQQRRIGEQIAELRSMLNDDNHGVTAGSDAPPPKRKFSQDALRRMREAQQRRWAKVRGESESSAPAQPSAPKRKRRLSAAGRAAIAAAQRKRWAAKKAGTQSAAAEKSGRSKQLKKIAA